MSAEIRSSAYGAFPIPAPVHFLALPVMLVGIFMVTLDFFIVNVALASIQRDLQATSAALQFVVVGYGLANCGLLITGGRLGDIFGRTNTLLAGVALFTAASAACGLAPTAPLLVIARVCQGAAGALIQPQVLALISSLFTGEQRTKAFAAYGLALGLGAISGQLIGGVLMHANIGALGWRSCFLINLPIGIAIILAGRHALPRLVPQSGLRLDAGGVSLLSAAILAISVPLIIGREQQWPAWSWVMLAASAPLMCLFMLQQRSLAARDGQPILPPALLAHRPYILGLFVVLLFYCGNASFYYVLAIYLQSGVHLSPLRAGLYFTVMAVAFFIASMVSPQLIRKFGARSILIGFGTLMLGHILMYAFVSAGDRGNAPVLLSILLVQGAGVGLVMAPLSAAVLSGVPQSHAGVASGAVGTVQQLGNALGVALIGIAFYGLGENAAQANVTEGFMRSLAYLGGAAAIAGVAYVAFVRASASLANNAVR